jgi:hypothetical protein
MSWGVRPPSLFFYLFSGARKVNKLLKQENPYEFMQGKAPCDTCKSSPYCVEARAICVAFDQYVSTGVFRETDRGRPVYNGYQELIEEKGHWRKRVFS